jgi:hypothetical protein
MMTGPIGRGNSGGIAPGSGNFEGAGAKAWPDLSLYSAIFDFYVSGLDTEALHGEVRFPAPVPISS